MHPPMDCGKRMVIISMSGFLSSQQVRVPGEQPPGEKSGCSTMAVGTCKSHVPPVRKDLKR